MADEQAAPSEKFVVLRDQEGHYYLLPQQTIDAARVSDDSVERLQALLEDEVSGYGIFPPHNPTHLISDRSINVLGGFASLNTSGIHFHAPTLRSFSPFS